MILLYLILAHLMGDFVFQPTSLVEWKIKSRKGMMVHVVIHFCLLMMIFTPFLLNGYYSIFPIILVICGLHYVIDESKISYDLKNDKKVKPFIFDQILHIVIIMGAFFLMKDVDVSFPETRFYSIYTSKNVLIFLSFLIFATEVREIYRFQKQREKNKNARFKLNTGELAKKIILFTAIYVLLMFTALFATNGYMNTTILY